MQILLLLLSLLFQKVIDAHRNKWNHSAIAYNDRTYNDLTYDVTWYDVSYDITTYLTTLHNNTSLHIMNHRAHIHIGEEDVRQIRKIKQRKEVHNKT